MEKAGVLEKDTTMLRMSPHEEEIVATDEQNDPTEYTHVSATGGGPDKEILRLGSVEIERLNYRLSTTSFVDGETLLHHVELECQDDECSGPVCNRWVFKSVNKNRHNVLDEADMFLPSLDFFYPVNFLL